MIYTDYRDNQERAKHSYEFIREAYPDEVENAYNMIVDYLSRYDRYRMRVFKAEVADRYYDSPGLETAHLLISSMLHQQRIGNPEATPLCIDTFARAYLFLPFAVVQGGKS